MKRDDNMMTMMGMAMLDDDPVARMRESQRRDIQAKLDDLLCRWHQWQYGCRVARGYNDRALVAGEYRASRQYDDENGALDDSLDDSRMRQVDFEVGEMQHPHKAAIYDLARGLTSGVFVWASPRLPTNPAERELVVTNARQILIRRLQSAGVL